MTWFGWLLVAWFVYSILVTAGTAEKQHRPPSVVVATIIIDGLFILGIFLVGTGRL